MSNKKQIAKAYVKIEKVYNDSVYKALKWLSIATFINSVNIIIIIWSN